MCLRKPALRYSNWCRRTHTISSLAGADGIYDDVVQTVAVEHGAYGSRSLSKTVVRSQMYDGNTPEARIWFVFGRIR